MSIKLFVVLLVALFSSEFLIAQDKHQLIGKWVESRNIVLDVDASEEKLVAQPYSNYSLMFTQQNNQIECEGLALYKPADSDLGSTRTGQINGMVTLSSETIPNKKRKTDHFVVRDGNVKNTKHAIYIELIDSNTIKVTQFEGAQLGGLGVAFDGLYKRVVPKIN